MTDHQPLPGIIWRGDLGQILLIQQGELQSPLLHQFANRCALQCGDPSKAGMQLELVDLRLRQHSAISHHHHPGQSKLFSQLLDLIRYRRGVSRVSRIHLHGHRTSLAIGHHPVDDDGQTLFPIAVVSKLCERTGAAPHKNYSTRRKGPSHLRADGERPVFSRCVPCAPKASPWLRRDRSRWPRPLLTLRPKSWCATHAWWPVSSRYRSAAGPSWPPPNPP